MGMEPCPPSMGMGSSETGCNIRSQWLEYTQNALAALSDICNILSRYSMWPECLRWRNLRPSTTIYMYNGRSQLFCLSNDLFVVTSGSSELSVQTTLCWVLRCVDWALLSTRATLLCCNHQSDRSAKKANVQVTCANFLTRILTNSQPLDKLGTPTTW
jgi:hypothetical protein